MRSIGLTVLTLFLSISSWAQSVTEDFNHNNIATSQSNCWEFDNVTIERPPSSKALSVGTNRPLASAALNGIKGNCALYSPFMKFSGSGSLDFDHKLMAATGESSALTVVIYDPSGAIVQTLGSHTYRSGNANASGDPTLGMSESYSITYSGYGRLGFVWAYTNSSTEGYVDNIEISGEYAADQTRESSGFCPAIMEVYDTVCSASSNLSLEALYNSPGNSYSWSFNGSSAGTFDYSISSNNAEVELDLDSTSGDFTILAIENATGHQTYYYLHVDPLPTLSYSIDSVCLEDPYAIQMTLTGTGPWTLEYRYDGISTQSIVINSSSYLLNLPGDAANFQFISLTDDNGCANTSAFLPSVTVPYFPKPGPTGPIYH